MSNRNQKSKLEKTTAILAFERIAKRSEKLRVFSSIDEIADLKRNIKY